MGETSARCMGETMMQRMGKRAHVASSHRASKATPLSGRAACLLTPRTQDNSHYPGSLASSQMPMCKDRVKVYP